MGFISAEVVMTGCSEASGYLARFQRRRTTRCNQHRDQVSEMQAGLGVAICLTTMTDFAVRDHGTALCEEVYGFAGVRVSGRLEVKHVFEP